MYVEYANNLPTIVRKKLLGVNFHPSTESV